MVKKLSVHFQHPLHNLLTALSPSPQLETIQEIIGRVSEVILRQTGLFNYRGNKGLMNVVASGYQNSKYLITAVKNGTRATAQVQRWRDRNDNTLFFTVKFKFYQGKELIYELDFTVDNDGNIGTGACIHHPLTF